MSHRIEQINQVVRQYLNDLILTEVEFPVGCLVTIVKVEASKDLRHAKVYISVMPTKFTAKALSALKRQAGILQFKLNKKLTIKPLPRISFAVDQTEKQAADIEQLLDQIKENGDI